MYFFDDVVNSRTQWKKKVRDLKKKDKNRYIGKRAYLQHEGSSDHGSSAENLRTIVGDE